MSFATGPLGSPSWTNHVFSTPPVRKLKGRSKFTQFHQFWSERMGRMVGAQGRNEAIAALALEHLTTLGHLVRFKEQPFQTSEEEFGKQIVPDFIATTADGQLYVIEVKSARFLTSLVQATMDENRRGFEKHGITYLWWTDNHPLTRPLRHNLLNMRRHAFLVTQEERAALTSFLSAGGSYTVSALIHNGFDEGVIQAAAWAGDAFFPITSTFASSTLVSRHPHEDVRAVFLAAEQGKDAWWDSLGEC